MGNLPADQSVRDRVVTEIDKNFLVEAGAGTGKTTLMVARLLELIRRGCPLAEIAAITFTEKAAQELKDRLRKELIARLKEENCPREQAQRFRRALAELESAQVTTIHSFSASLLRERPVEAGLDPKFTIIEPLEQEAFISRCWRKWLEREMEHPPYSLRLYLQAGCSLQDLYQLLLSLYGQRDIALPPSRMTWDVLVSRLQQAIAGAVADLSDQVDLCHNPEDKGYQSAGAEIAGCCELLQKDRESFFLDLLTGAVKIPGGKKGNKNNWPGGSLEEFRNARETVKEILEQGQKAAGDWLVREIVGWLQGFIKQLDAEKHRQGLLDFEDLLIKARDLLRDNTGVRKYFQKRFRHLLVDEFQDTDPLQAEIVFYLAESPGRGPAVVWEQAIPGPGRLFVVGDPKQSIYRFRRADIEIYRKVQQLIVKAGGETAFIQANFRSRPEILTWVNDRFSHLLDYIGYVPLLPQRSPWAGGPLVEQIPAPSQEEDDIDEVRRQEAEALARLVAGILAEPGRWPVGTGAGHRDICPGDIALLVPKRTKIYLLEEALRDRGIDYILEGGKTFYQRPEVQAVLAVLKSVCRPYNQIDLLAALRSPLFGCSDREIYEYCSSGGSLNFHADPPGRFPCLKAAFSLLREMHRNRNSAGVSQIIADLLTQTSAPEVFLTVGGERAVGNLDKIVQLARRFETQRGGTLGRFVDWMGRMWSEMKEEAESPSLEEAENAVVITTVHKAKGLEYPLVIMGGLHSKVSHSAGKVIADRLQGQMEVCLKKGIATGGYQHLADAEKKQLEDEIKRLLYVAATRAQDYLIISPYKRSRGKDYLDYLGDLSDLPERKLPVTAPAPAEQEREEDFAVILEDWEQRMKVARSVKEKLPLVISPSGSEHYFAACGARDDISGPPAATPSLAGGIAFGTALHNLLQQLPLPSPPGQEEKEHLISIYSPFPGAQEGLRLHVNNFLHSESFRRMQAARRCWREVPFALTLEGVFVEGRVDLLVEEEGGLVIIDYKSDNLVALDPRSRERRLEGYRSQGALYALALAEVSGKAVKDVVFIFTATGKEWHPGKVGFLQEEARRYLRTLSISGRIP